MPDFKPIFNDEDFATDDDTEDEKCDEMGDKKKKVEYAINPDAIEAARAVGSGVNFAVNKGKMLLGLIKPGQQEELDKLKKEVTKMEAENKLAEEIAALKKKKADLAAKKSEKDNVAYA